MSTLLLLTVIPITMSDDMAKEMEKRWNKMTELIADLTEQELMTLESVVENQINWINGEEELVVY